MQVLKRSFPSRLRVWVGGWELWEKPRGIRYIFCGPTDTYNIPACILLLAFLVCIDTYNKESCQKAEKLKAYVWIYSPTTGLLNWGSFEVKSSWQPLLKDPSSRNLMCSRLFKLEEHHVAPAFSEVKITLLAPCKIDENAAGDWGYQLRNTQECYLLTERGHFSASNLQLRRHTGLLVGPCM